jgi:hypothetical protein
MANLFAGLAKDVESGSPLHYIDKCERGGGLKLVSSANSVASRVRASRLSLTGFSRRRCCSQWRS